MKDLFKLLGKGFIYLFLIPLGICFFIIYGIYLLIVWIIMFFRTIVLFFQGKPTGLTLEEDIKAQNILNAARDFSEPQQMQQQPQQGVTFNLNINGQPIGQNLNSLQNNNRDVLDYSAKQIEQKEGGTNNE